MALQSMNKILWTYTDDNGVDWSVTATKAITDQLDTGTPKVGGAAGDNADPPWPRSWRKRKVYMTAGATRKAVVAYDTTALIWTTAGTTLTLNNGADSSSYAATVAHLGERKRAATGSTS